MRRTVISMWQSSNVSIDTIRNQVGHTDANTTLNNYTYDVTTVEEQARLLNDSLNF
jgi:integrase